MSGDTGRVGMLDLEASREAAKAAGLVAQFAELSVFRTLLQNPPVAKAVQDLLIALLFRGKLDARLRELVIMRLGWATRSDYEWTQHWKVALELGVPEDDLLALRDWRRSERFDAADRCVLAATDDTLEHGTITPETWSEVERNLGSVEERLELVSAIGTWRMISGLLRSLEVPLEDGVESWPPDGRAPQEDSR